MAGEAFNTDLAVKVVTWAGSALVYGTSLIVYVKGMLKSHSAQLAEHKAMITEIQSKQANGVRPQDLANTNKRIDDATRATNEKLDLILELVKSKK